MNNSQTKLCLAVSLFAISSFMIPSLRPTLLLSKLLYLANPAVSVSSMATPYSMVFVTAPNQEVAKKIAGGLGKNLLHGYHVFINIVFS